MVGQLGATTRGIQILKEIIYKQFYRIFSV
jgi:hypothetical protein